MNIKTIIKKLSFLSAVMLAPFTSQADILFSEDFSDIDTPEFTTDLASGVTSINANIIWRASTDANATVQYSEGAWISSTSEDGILILDPANDNDADYWLEMNITALGAHTGRGYFSYHYTTGGSSDGVWSWHIQASTDGIHWQNLPGSYHYQDNNLTSKLVYVPVKDLSLYSHYRFKFDDNSPSAAANWRLNNVSLHSGDTAILEYKANASNPTNASEVADPLTIEGGIWAKNDSSLGARDLQEGVLVTDGITSQSVYAWKSRDDDHNNNPGYKQTLTTEHMQKMWDNGWQSTTILQLSEGAHFYSWTTRTNAPSGTYDDNKRYGMTLANNGGFLRINPQGASAFDTSAVVGSDFVKIVMSGQPQSKTYDISAYDLNDNLLGQATNISPANNTFSASFGIQSGSSASDNREILLNQFSLASLEPTHSTPTGVIFKTGFNERSTGFGKPAGLPVDSTASNIAQSEGGLGAAGTKYPLESGSTFRDITMHIVEGSVDTYGTNTSEGDSALMIGHQNSGSNTVDFDFNEDVTIGIVNFRTRGHNRFYDGTLTVSALTDDDTILATQSFPEAGARDWKPHSFNANLNNVRKIRFTYSDGKTGSNHALYLDELIVTDYTDIDTQTVVASNSFETLGLGNWLNATSRSNDSRTIDVPATITDANDRNNIYESIGLRTWYRVNGSSTANVASEGNAALYFEQLEDALIIKPSNNDGIGTIFTSLNTTSGSGNVDFSFFARRAGESEWGTAFTIENIQGAGYTHSSIDFNRAGDWELKIELTTKNSKNAFLDSLTITNFPYNTAVTDSAAADHGRSDVDILEEVALVKVLLQAELPAEIQNPPSSIGINAATLDLTGTTSLDDISSVKLYATNTTDTLDTESATLLATLTNPVAGDNLVVFDSTYSINSQPHYLWVTVDAGANSSPGDILAITLKDITADTLSYSTLPAATYSAALSGTLNRPPTLDNFMAPAFINVNQGALISFDINDFEGLPIDVTAVVTNGSHDANLPISNGASGSNHSVLLSTTLDYADTLTIEFTLSDGVRQTVVEKLIPITATNDFENVTNLSSPIDIWLGNNIADGSTMSASAGVSIDSSGLISNLNSIALPSGEFIEFNLAGNTGYIERLTFKTAAKVSDSNSLIRLESKQTSGGSYSSIFEGNIDALNAISSDINLAIDRDATDLFIKITNLGTTDGDGVFYIDNVEIIDDAYLKPSIEDQWNNTDDLSVDSITINGKSLNVDTGLNDETQSAPDYIAVSGDRHYINWTRIDGSKTAALKPGDDNTFTVEHGPGQYTSRSIYYYFWLDSNGDGEFADSEYLGTSNTNGNSSDSVMNSTFSIPAEAALGTTRLRIRSVYDQVLTASDASTDIAGTGNQFGETEDYLVTIDSDTVFLPTIEPAVFFTDNMVIQRHKDMRIWGRGFKSGHTVTATLKNASNITIATSSGTIGADLKFSFDISADLAASTEAHTLEIVGSNGDNAFDTTLTYTGIVIGDVWIASGQSNMDYTISNMKTKTTALDGDMDPDNFPNIRLFKTTPLSLVAPKENPIVINGGWMKADNGNSADDSNLDNYSAAAYYFAANLSKELTSAAQNIPIGVIIGAQGSTEIEEWMDEDGLPLYQSYAHANWLENTGNSPDNKLAWTSITPGNSFNGTLYATTNFPAKGFLWYQGEYNFGNSAKNGIPNYGSMLKDLADRWRTIFNMTSTEAPFYTVELAPHRYDTHAGANDSSGFGAFKQGMRQILELNNTGIAYIGDDITANSVYTNHVDSSRHNNAIHPARKDIVGERLARLALENDYGIDLAGDASGPLATSATLNETGNTLTIQFQDAEGLNRENASSVSNTWIYANSHTPSYIEGSFEVAGANGVYTPVDWSNVIIVDNQVAIINVDNPVHVRYAFGENDNINLKNSAGIPAASFSIATEKRGSTDRAIQLPVAPGETLQIQNDNNFASVRGLTTEAWINPTAAPTGAQQIFNRWTGNNSDTSFAFIRETDNRLTVKLKNALNNNDEVIVTTDAPVLTDDTWQHVAFTFNTMNNEIIIYVNGTNVKQGSASFMLESDSTLAITIGSDNVGGEQFVGSIDEVRIWTKALKPTEITAGYTEIMTPEKAKQQQQLFVAYNFNYTDNASDTAFDLKGAINAVTSANTNLTSVTTTDFLKDFDEDGISNAVDNDDDNDGVSDTDEVTDGTNPLNPDSDGDGFDDKEEKDAGTDPNDSNDFPDTIDIQVIQAASGLVKSGTAGQKVMRIDIKDASGAEVLNGLDLNINGHNNLDAVKIYLTQNENYVLSSPEFVSVYIDGFNPEVEGDYQRVDDPTGLSFIGNYTMLDSNLLNTGLPVYQKGDWYIWYNSNYNFGAGGYIISKLDDTTQWYSDENAEAAIEDIETWSLFTDVADNFPTAGSTPLVTTLSPAVSFSPITTETPAASITISGLTETLSIGDNYIWVVFDIASSAIAGEIVDAECQAIELNGSVTNTAIANPPGELEIASTELHIYDINGDAEDENTFWQAEWHPEIGDVGETAEWNTDTQHARSGSRSLQLINGASKTSYSADARIAWKGQTVTLQNATSYIRFSAWSKAINVDVKKDNYTLLLHVDYEDGTQGWSTPAGGAFYQGTHDWQQAIGHYSLNKKATAVTPHLCLFKGSGTVYFDDMQLATLTTPEASLPYSEQFTEEPTANSGWKHFISGANTANWVGSEGNAANGALEIVNTDGAATIWYGPVIDIPAGNFNVSVAAASQADSVTVTGAHYSVRARVTYIDNTTEWLYTNQCAFDKDLTGWQYAGSSFTTDKEIKTVQPLLILNGTGTVHFDDVSVTLPQIRTLNYTENIDDVAVTLGNWLTHISDINNDNAALVNGGRTGDLALKLTNNSAGHTDWRGPVINVDPAIRAISYSVWSRAETPITTSPANYFMRLRIVLADDSVVWTYSPKAAFSGANTWNQAGDVITFNQDIKTVQAIAVLRNTTGTVYFDDVQITPISQELPYNVNFDLGIEPYGWYTGLGNVEWTEDEGVGNSGAAKMIHATASEQSMLRGPSIDINPGVTSLRVQAWSKAENLQEVGRGDYFTRLRVVLADNSVVWTEPAEAQFAEAAIWTELDVTFDFGQDVKSVEALLYFRNASGTVWFDNISITDAGAAQGASVPNEANSEGGTQENSEGQSSGTSENLSSKLKQLKLEGNFLDAELFAELLEQEGLINILLETSEGQINVLITADEVFSTEKTELIITVTVSNQTEIDLISDIDAFFDIYYDEIEVYEILEVSTEAP